MRKKRDWLDDIEERAAGGDMARMIWEVRVLRRRVWDWRGIAAAGTVLAAMVCFVLGMAMAWPK